MTLFKQVFQKHLEEQGAATAELPDWSSSPPPDPGELAPPPQMVTPGPAVHPGLPEMGKKPDPAPELDAVAPLPPTEADAEADAPDVDPALVARAAEAHRMMVETRSRQAPSDPSAPLPGRAVPPAEPSAAPAPSSRTRTRLLGFDTEAVQAANPMDAPSAAAARDPFPCGWLVITSGPGRGESFALHSGVSMIGRGEDQAICLDFGDRAISRQNHAAIAFDPETAKFYLGHGGKSNIIRLNGAPVLSTEELAHGDSIRIGETHVRFAAFCDATFSWSEAEV